MRPTIFECACIASALAICLAPGPAPAQPSYPNKPIRMIVPFAAGGSTDTLARAVAQKLSESLGQTVFVENRAGGNATIGSEALRRSAPDGYTIMMTSVDHTVIPQLLTTPYDPINDFTAVGPVAYTQMLLVANPEVPVNNVAEFLALAKAKPGQLSYGSAGPGSPQNLSFELLKTLTGINIVHVPYRGDGPALTDLVAGHIPTMFGEPTPILPLLKDGKVRALGVSSASRLPIAPDVPTIAEAGVPGFDLTSWQMIVAPAGTPQEIVDKLHVEVKKVLELPEVKAEFARTARITVDYPSVDDLQRFMRSEIVRLGKVVEHAGIARSQ